MSFRNTFITDFIYMATDDHKDFIDPLNDTFEAWADSLSSKLDDRGYGYFAGINRTHSGELSEHQDYIQNFLYDIASITKVPFRLTMLLESNAVITYNVEPR